jgi:hypothetical protein
LRASMFRDTSVNAVKVLTLCYAAKSQSMGLKCGALELLDFFLAH